MSQYSMMIQWSDEDQLFLVTIPEFAERVMMPCTHGNTREEAIHQGEQVIEMYLEAWKAEGQPIPNPTFYKLFKCLYLLSATVNNLPCLMEYCRSQRDE